MLHAITLAAILALAPPWNWPVDPPHSVVRPYIPPETPYSAGHRGVDLAAPGGTVYAPADGVVHFAGIVVDRPLLSIEHPGGLLTSYEPVETSLEAGDSVLRGQVIASVAPGHCASLCLHFGVRVNGSYASPLAWLGGAAPAVLLPTRAGHAVPGASAHGSVRSRPGRTALRPPIGQAAWARHSPERTYIRQRGTSQADFLDRTSRLSPTPRRADAPVGSSP